MGINRLLETLRQAEAKELGDGASDSEIAEAEKGLGLTFPPDFREYLRRFGYVAVGDLEMFGLGAGVPKHLDLVAVAMSERTVMDPPLSPRLVPLCNDGAGNHFCLDTSQGPRFPVVFWDHEAGSDQTPSLVARDFIEWLSEEILSRKDE